MKIVELNQKEVSIVAGSGKDYVLYLFAFGACWLVGHTIGLAIANRGRSGRSINDGGAEAAAIDGGSDDPYALTPAEIAELHRGPRPPQTGHLPTSRGLCD